MATWSLGLRLLSLLPERFCSQHPSRRLRRRRRRGGRRVVLLPGPRPDDGPPRLPRGRERRRRRHDEREPHGAFGHVPARKEFSRPSFQRASPRRREPKVALSKQGEQTQPRDHVASHLSRRWLKRNIEGVLTLEPLVKRRSRACQAVRAKKLSLEVWASMLVTVP